MTTNIFPKWELLTFRAAVIRNASGYPPPVELTRWLSLLSSISTIGRESVNVRVSKDY